MTRGAPPNLQLLPPASFGPAAPELAGPHPTTPTECGRVSIPEQWCASKSKSALPPQRDRALPASMPRRRRRRDPGPLDSIRFESMMKESPRAMPAVWLRPVRLCPPVPSPPPPPPPRMLFHSAFRPVASQPPSAPPPPPPPPRMLFHSAFRVASAVATSPQGRRACASPLRCLR